MADPDRDKLHSDGRVAVAEDMAQRDGYSNDAYPGYRSGQSPHDLIVAMNAAAADTEAMIVADLIAVERPTSRALILDDKFSASQFAAFALSASIPLAANFSITPRDLDDEPILDMSVLFKRSQSFYKPPKRRDTSLSMAESARLIKRRAQRKARKITKANRR
jgi:hypothetical protein